MTSIRIRHLVGMSTLAVFCGCSGTAAPTESDDRERLGSAHAGGESVTYGDRGIHGALPTRFDTRESVQRMIVAEAVAHGTVPPDLALAIARTASNFSTRTLGVTGLVGVMQLPAERAAQTEADDTVPAAVANVRAALDDLARLHGIYDDWTLALSHYRGGPLLESGDDPVYQPHAYTTAFVDEVLYWQRQYGHDPIIAAWIREASGLSRFVDDHRPVRHGSSSHEAWYASGYAGRERRHGQYGDPADCDRATRVRSHGTWRAVGTRRFR